jgi:hypothetical protein
MAETNQNQQPNPRPQTQAEARKAEFDRHARLAQNLADLALSDIDAALEECEIVTRPRVTL